MQSYNQGYRERVAIPAGTVAKAMRLYSWAGNYYKQLMGIDRGIYKGLHHQVHRAF